MKKLSILICSLESRKRYLNRLMNILNAQKTDDVEILVEIDNGEMSIGKKRNILLDKSTGLFSCYCDDDDRVATNYVSKILQAVESSPDCVGIEGIMTTNGKDPRKFIHSLRYNTWFEKGGIYYRCNNHLNPIKTEISRLIKFPEISHGEDRDFSEKIRPYLKTEIYINGPIYFYDFVSSK